MAQVTRRDILKATASCLAVQALRPISAQPRNLKVFDAAKYGAIGDGKTLDSPAIQRAIDAAADYGKRARVLIRGGKRYVIGTIELKGQIDFHLADDAELLASTRREDYLGGLAGSMSPEAMATAGGGLIIARAAQGLTISGTGSVQGRAREFMERYDAVGEWYIPREFRPKMFLLTACRDLEVRDITFAEAPNWGLHLLGCEGALIDHVTVNNLLDVPNCDGIDLDHSRKVEVKNCQVTAGDDAIVVKASRQTKDYGDTSHVHVSDCILQTQDAGLKIGTETTADVHDILFERCKVVSGSRGLCIQLRDEGSVYNVDFRDIEFTSRYYADPWWGRGEAISFTAIPRKPETKLGSLHHVTVKNVKGHAENSVRIWGSPQSRVQDVTLDNVEVTLKRSTPYKGGLYDNRPTTVMQPIEPHETSGFSIRDADDITLRDCKVHWGANPPDYFGKALDQQNVTGLKLERFNNRDAHSGTTAHSATAAHSAEGKARQ